MDKARIVAPGSLELSSLQVLVVPVDVSPIHESEDLWSVQPSMTAILQCPAPLPVPLHQIFAHQFVEGLPAWEVELLRHVR